MKAAFSAPNSLDGAEEFDFIIVGAGSAGCVLADRLTAGGEHRVLLLEVGGTHKRFFVEMPAGFGRTYYDPDVNWCYETEPDANLADRSDYWPRGKILGGSSSINGMVYIRGQHEDFDDWRRLGNVGWGFSDVLPYFRKSEDNDGGANEYRGAGGPWKISGIRGRESRIVQLASASFEALGYTPNPDFNGSSQDGVGLYQFSIHKGKRTSNAVAFLEPAMRRPNLRVETHAFANRVLFHDRQAIGVEYKIDGQIRVVRCRKEVLVCAGTINSPLLLQHSGIGSGELLRSHGLAVVADSPAVGENLQDHVYTGFSYKTRLPTLNNQLNTPLGQLIAGVQYVLTKSGPLTFGINQGGAFLRTRPEETRPDTQLYFFPLSFSAPPNGARGPLRPHRFSGMTFNASPCRPESRGQVKIRSADPGSAPIIHRNYLSTPNDIRVMVDTLKIIDKVVRTPPLSGAILERVHLPDQHLDDAALENWARRTGRTTYHPTSTCTMGTDPRRSVVDPSLKVHGVTGLRVIDASIMPLIVSGNTAAATTMIGEKGADLVLKAWAPSSKEKI